MFAITYFANGQKFGSDFGQIPMDDMQMQSYPLDSSASAVILFDKGEAALDDGLKLVFKRHVRIKFFRKDAVDEWATENIFVEKATDAVSKLRASSYNLENGVIVESKMEETSLFKTKLDRYVDEWKFTLPNVKEGTVIEYSYIVSSNSSLLPSWQFQYTIPSRLSQYEIFFPTTFSFRKDLQGFLSITDVVSKNKGANEKWTMRDVPAFKVEPFLTTPSDYVSKIHFHIDQVFIPGQRLFNLTQTWNGIAEDLMKDGDFGLQIRGSNFLEKTVSELTGSTKDPAEIQNIVCSYVKKNIKWNGVIDKIPDHSFKKVLEEKTGSSSEINLLMVSMLQKAGLQADPVLISTRKHGKIRPFNPSFSQFNDVICAVTVNEKTQLLDGTDPYLPNNALPERCLNGSGFLVSKNPDWVDVKCIKARTVVGVELKVDPSGELNGKITISRDGLDGAAMRRSFHDTGDEKYVAGIFEGKSWQISKSDFKNIDDISQVPNEVHELVISDHAQSTGSIIYLNPFILSRMEENIFRSDTRAYPVDFTTPFDKFYFAKIALPEGFVVDELPAQKVFMLPENGGKFLFSANLVGNTINVSSQLTIFKNIFLEDEYAGLREFYDRIVAKQAEQIVLKRK